jgi:hypothetical protein
MGIPFDRIFGTNRNEEAIMPERIPLTLKDDQEIDALRDDIIWVEPEGSLTRVYFRGGQSRLVKHLSDIVSVTHLRNGRRG